MTDKGINAIKVMLAIDGLFEMHGSHATTMTLENIAANTDLSPRETEAIIDSLMVVNAKKRLKINIPALKIKREFQFEGKAVHLEKHVEEGSITRNVTYTVLSGTALGIPSELLRFMYRVEVATND